MSGILAKLFGGGDRRRRAEQVLEAVTRQSRLPVFYERFGVADTLDGRFDMMALHGAIVFYALRRKGRDGAELAQDTTDLMFMAFDDAIRSLGVGDPGIPRRVKAMAKAYIGRASAYTAATAARDRTALADAIARNVYRGDALAPETLLGFAAYVLDEAIRLETWPLTAVQHGELGFGQPVAEAVT